jgi:hypothetical protein
MNRTSDYNSDPNLKDRILEIFNTHRKFPAQEFDENHFLDYLMDSPKVKGAFRNSFSGLRRFNAFLNEIQLEFKVCFKLEDRDKNFSLDQFAHRVSELTESKKSSLAALRHQMKYGFEWRVFLILNAVLLLPISLFQSKTILIYGYAALVVAANFVFVTLYLKQKNYLRKLYNAINETN